MMLVGYHVIKFFRDTPSIIGYVAMAPDDSFVEFHDTCLTPGAAYAVMPVYHRWTQRDAQDRVTIRSPETRIEGRGDKSVLAPTSLSQLVEPSLGGEGHQFYDEEAFPPTKLALIDGLDAVFGGEGHLYWLDSSFDPIGT